MDYNLRPIHSYSKPFQKLVTSPFPQLLQSNLIHPAALYFPGVLAQLILNTAVQEH